ncbi:MAG: hypothetical protein ABFS43_20025 [Thermodesulfobacteriota bacterium]
MGAIRKWVILGVALACFAGFTACEKEGAAEKAGKSIDKAMKDLGKKVD